MKRNKLYTVNSVNKLFLGNKINTFDLGGLAAKDKAANPWNYADDVNTVWQYLNSKNVFGISKAVNPFSKVNLAGGLGAMVNTPIGGSILSGLAGTVGNIGGNLIGGGLESGAGNAIGSIGSTVGGAIGAANPVLGAAVSVGSLLVGGLVNRAFGTKVDQAKLRAAEAGTAAYNNFRSNASSFDDITGPTAQNNVLNAYKGGWFSSGKARRKNEELRRQRNEAMSYAFRSVDNNINNLADDQMNNALANFAAFGGPLEGIDVTSPIGYSFMNLYLENKNKNKDNNMTNIFAGTPSTMFDLGGVIQTKGGTWGDVTHVDAGGTHELNPNDGVLLGTDSQGVPNLVEEGELIYNDYVFSNRLIVSRGKRGNYGKRNKYSKGSSLNKEDEANMDYTSKALKPFEGLTFAEAAKKAEKLSGVTERPNDPISLRGLEASLSILAGVQEKEREKEKLQDIQDKIDNMTPEEFAMLQQLMQAQETELEVQPQEQQALIPLQEIEEIQPTELQQPIAALGGLLNSNNQFKYGGNLEKFTNELQSYGLTLEDYLNYFVNQKKSEGKVYDMEKLIVNDDNFDKNVAEQYLKHVDKAQREIARKYKKEGLNPDNLTGAGLQAYKRDVLSAVRGASVSDDNLAINNFYTKNKGSAKESDFNNYAYTRTTKENLISGGASELKTDSEGKFNINYGRENPEGLSYIEGMPKWNVSSNKWEDADGNTIDNPFGEGTKFSNVTGGGYNSEFSNQDELSQYYRDQIAKKFQSLKGDNYKADMLPRYYLSKDELGNWISDLEGSEQAKDKELARMLKANWNFDKDELVESDAYLNLPATKDKKLQRDKKPGIEHIPYLEAIPYAGARYREVGLDGKPTDNYVQWDTQNPVEGFSVMEEPLSTEGGVTTYGILRNNLASHVGVLPNGTFVLMTPELADLYANNKINDTSTLPQFNTPLKGYEHTPTYYDLSKDAQGNLLGLKNEDSTDPFPEAPMWPYAAGLGLQAGALAYNMLTPADYSNANALINASKNAGDYKPVQFRPIGNQLTYKPMDIWYELNRLNANARATDRNILNTSGSNRGTAMAGILANAYNNQIASGDLYRKALEYNDALRKQVEEFNRDTDKFNSEGFLKSDMANQDAASRAAGYKLEGLKSGYTMRQAIEDAKANAVSAGISGIGTMLYNMADTNYKNKLLGWGIRNNAYAPQKSKGGKVKRRKGLSF